MTGSGTALDPYIISSVADWQAINNNLTAYYELASDLDCTGQDVKIFGSPVGFNSFSGHLDAREHILSNVAIGYYVSTTACYGGLFYGVSGSVSNLNLTSVTATEAVSNKTHHVGLFAYTVSGSVQNCHIDGVVADIEIGAGLTSTVDLAGFVKQATGHIEDCSVKNISLIATGKQWQSAVGFIALVNNGGIIDNCFVGGGSLSAVCSGTYADVYASGFCRFVNTGGLIKNCYTRLASVSASGATVNNYADGFVRGNASGTVENSYSVIDSFTGNPVSGFCGTNSGTITACFWDTETSGVETSDGGTGKTTSEMKQISTFSAWDILLSATSLNNGYPFLGWQADNGIAWLIYGALSPREEVEVEDKITLEAIRNIEMAAKGRFYVDEEGNATYKSRLTRS